MTEAAKIRVAVVYGGRSTEHEVSLQSAASVVANLDPNTYEVVPISVDRQGRFHRHDVRALRAAKLKVLPVGEDSETLAIAPRPAGPLFAGAATPPIDVVFPVMHGPLCEDGSIQGMLELANVPYVGSRVLGSAICMDKDVAKRLVRAEGVAIAPYVAFQLGRWQREADALVARIETELGYPAFVKPATLGSSIGVTRAKNRQELRESIALAQQYDDKVLVERAVNAREIELAVLASQDPSAPPEVSVPGEIAAADAFYSFDRKYLDEAGATLHVPAPLDAATTRKAQELARRCFLALECEGMARIDFLLDRDSGELYFGEANTIPGFTAISMYPKLWQASGVGYSALLDRLIRDALGRAQRRSGLRRER